MNAQEILRALGAADEDLLSEADQLRTAPRKKTVSHNQWLALAACLCLLCIGAWRLQKPSASPQPIAQMIQASTSPSERNREPVQTITPTQKVELWTPYYNEASRVTYALRQDICLFSAELSKDEVLSFLPFQIPEWFSPEGYGVFYGEGLLRHICLTGNTSLSESPITITIGSEAPFSCYMPVDITPQFSYCNGVQFLVSRCNAPDGSVALYGETKLNDCYYTFSLQGTQDTIAQNEADFVMILEAYSESEISPEDLAAIKPREIPEIFDKTLSLKEALALEPYGSYFLAEIPAGYEEESIHHYQDPYTAYLSGLWTRGYDELSWRVSELSEEDKRRLTHAENTERYDLSLYPIPRADSVPEELREVVDNPIFYAEELTAELIWRRAYKSGEQGDSNGWRMSFSVLYGDMIIKVRSKGVDPDWLYKQLREITP